jgi:hypothetical protein
VTGQDGPGISARPGRLGGHGGRLQQLDVLIEQMVDVLLQSSRIRAWSLASPVDNNPCRMIAHVSHHSSVVARSGIKWHGDVASREVSLSLSPKRA